MHMYVCFFIKLQLKESLTKSGKPECESSLFQKNPPTATKRKSTDNETKATKPKKRTATYNSSQQQQPADFSDVRILS